MRILGTLAFAALLAAPAPAQYRGFNSTVPRITGTFGSVVFPGGVAGSSVQRSFGNVVFPGGGGIRTLIPNRTTDPTRGLRPAAVVSGSSRRLTVVPYAYPLYVGGYYGSAYYPVEAAPQPAQNVTVIYPPQPAPVIVNPYGDSAAAPAREGFRLYEPEPRRPAAEQAPPQPEVTQYLLAFKDHTVYSTVAYWVDGDTIHYFTAGNKHNQASVSLVDRELTTRLNKDTGAEVKLPPEK